MANTTTNEPQNGTAAEPVVALKNKTQNLPQDLSKRAVKGGVWLFALRIANRGLGFVRTVILAKLLSPHDFGLLGVAMLAISTLDAFSQTGVQAALVHKKDNVESYLDVAWTISIFRGLALCLLLLLGAPLIANFFNSPESKWVIVTISVNMLLTGVSNIAIVLFQKELEFNKQFAYEVSSTAVDLILSIWLAFVLKSVWALVLSGIAKNLVRCILSYVFHPYRPKLCFSRKKFKDLFHFGIWILGSTILVFLITQGDDILVGRLLGVAALGIYQMAYLISNLPVTELSDVISRVTFPAYAKLQNDPARLRQAYLSVLQVTAYLTVPMAGAILVLGHEITSIFLGPQWSSAVPTIQVLALGGLVNSICATARPVFQGVGRPEVDTRWHIVRLLIMASILYPLTMRWGLIGTAIGVLASTCVTTIGFIVQVVRITRCSYLDFGKMTLIPLINSAIMMAVIAAAKQGLGKVNFEGLIFLSATGLIAYLLMTYIFEKSTDYGAFKMVSQIRAHL